MARARGGDAPKRKGKKHRKKKGVAISQQGAARRLGRDASRLRRRSRICHTALPSTKCPLLRLARRTAPLRFLCVLDSRASHSFAAQPTQLVSSSFPFDTRLCLDAQSTSKSASQARTFVRPIMIVTRPYPPRRVQRARLGRSRRRRPQGRERPTFALAATLSSSAGSVDKIERMTRGVTGEHRSRFARRRASYGDTANAGSAAGRALPRGAIAFKDDRAFRLRRRRRCPLHRRSQRRLHRPSLTLVARGDQRARLFARTAARGRGRPRDCLTRVASPSPSRPPMTNAHAPILLPLP